jgi:hypothetical protein
MIFSARLPLFGSEDYGRSYSLMLVFRVGAIPGKVRNGFPAGIA